ncbi:hypothetical protein BC831DRAFT_483299 [Entophlyctis helioformis]|nr:hypothetical protein BC831DRAFT_483299 [Entophlyctis helioformis]
MHNRCTTDAPAKRITPPVAGSIDQRWGWCHAAPAASALLPSAMLLCDAMPCHAKPACLCWASRLGLSCCVAHRHKRAASPVKVRQLCVQARMCIQMRMCVRVCVRVHACVRIKVCASCTCPVVCAPRLAHPSIQPRLCLSIPAQCPTATTRPQCPQRRPCDRRARHCPPCRRVMCKARPRLHTQISPTGSTASSPVAWGNVAAQIQLACLGRTRQLCAPARAAPIHSRRKLHPSLAITVIQAVCNGAAVRSPTVPPVLCLLPGSLADQQAYSTERQRSQATASPDTLQPAHQRSQQPTDTTQLHHQDQPVVASPCDPTDRARRPRPRPREREKEQQAVAAGCATQHGPRCSQAAMSLRDGWPTASPTSRLWKDSATVCPPRALSESTSTQPRCWTEQRSARQANPGDRQSASGEAEACGCSPGQSRATEKRRLCTHDTRHTAHGTRHMAHGISAHSDMDNHAVTGSNAGANTDRLCPTRSQRARLSECRRATVRPGSVQQPPGRARKAGPRHAMRGHARPCRLQPQGRAERWWRCAGRWHDGGGREWLQVAVPGTGRSLFVCLYRASAVLWPGPSSQTV